MGNPNITIITYCLAIGFIEQEREVIASNARSLPMKSVRQLSAIAAFSLFLQPSFAQKLVDPNTVAPEFRPAAEKRAG